MKFLILVPYRLIPGVPMEGLEPPHLAASDPKSDVSANFTTWAFKGCKSKWKSSNKKEAFKIHFNNQCATIKFEQHIRIILR